MIRWLSTPDGARLPVDVERDPNGNLEAVKIGKGWGVRVLTDSERTRPGSLPRYTTHWTTCPQPQQYRRRAHSAAPSTFPARAELAAQLSVRSGPCSVCRAPNPCRYGPGPASPLCPSCRTARGLPPVC